MTTPKNSAGTRKGVRPYRCFLVRCWLEEGALPDALPGGGRPGEVGRGSEPAWRFTVQQVGPAAARRGFACLRDVVAYIEAELASCAIAQDKPLNPLILSQKEIIDCERQSQLIPRRNEHEKPQQQG